MGREDSEGLAPHERCAALAVFAGWKRVEGNAPHPDKAGDGRGYTNDADAAGYLSAAAVTEASKEAGMSCAVL